jgi:hypothetical protein
MSGPFVSLELVADAGLPMILLTFPAMLLLLIPVIGIEAFLCKKWLGLTTRDAIRSNTIANLVSTIIGIPIAWAFMFGVEFATLGGILSTGPVLEDSNSPLARVILFVLSSAWIAPPERGHVWIIPCAVLVLLVPFFFASYGVEYVVIKHMLGMPEGGTSRLSSQRIRTAVRNSNLVTYGIMAFVTSVLMIREFLLGH